MEGAGRGDAGRVSDGHLLVRGKDLFACGTFFTVGDEPNFYRIASWNGTHWTHEASGRPSGRPVGRMAFAGSTLYTAGGPWVYRRHPNGEWEELAEELFDQFRGLHHFENAIYVGGSFRAVAPGLPAWRVARWDLDPPTPVELASFDAERLGRSARIRWSQGTASPWTR